MKLNLILKEMGLQDPWDMKKTFIIDQYEVIFFVI